MIFWLCRKHSQINIYGLNIDNIPTSCNTSYDIFKLDSCPNIEDFYRPQILQMFQNYLSASIQYCFHINRYALIPYLAAFGCLMRGTSRLNVKCTDYFSLFFPQFLRFLIYIDMHLDILMTVIISFIPSCNQVVKSDCVTHYNN